MIAGSLLLVLGDELQALEPVMMLLLRFLLWECCSPSIISRSLQLPFTTRHHHIS